ncbi:MAG: HEAT repeat domain-containing protein [Gemmatimonadales bacterium]
MLSILSILLAVTTVAQESAAPAAPARARRHRHPAWSASMPSFVAPLAALDVATSALAMAEPSLSMVAMQAPVLAVLDQALSAPAFALSVAPLSTFGIDDFDDEEEPSEPDFAQAEAVQGDVADSLYRSARQALNNNQYQRAADLFRSIRDKYPRSTYVPNTYYWQAFALYRSGSDDELRSARTALRAQADRYPKASTRRDAEVLLRRVQGELARQGDEEAMRAIGADVDAIAPPGGVIAATPPVGPVPAIAPAPGGHYRLNDASCDDEDDVRIAALNAVLQMDADRAVPLLKTVLARRDEGSACLRRKAVFLVSQKRSDETSRILLNAVRSDPDQEVREQAVFWLSQVPGDETVAALDSILRGSTDTDIQDKAIFALSQHRSTRAGAILRAYAERRDAPGELREKTIFWLGQNRSADNAQFLKDLYKKLDDDDLKEKVIFSLSQMGGTDNYRWLMDIALDQHEQIEIRKKALFWAGQGNSVDVADLVRLYDSMTDREMKEQLIFVYSQRRETAALDKLFAIGKNDPDRELRKKAIFWIGQSRDPRAAQYLQELINQ